MATSLQQYKGGFGSQFKTHTQNTRKKQIKFHKITYWKEERRSEKITEAAAATNDEGRSC